MKRYAKYYQIVWAILFVLFNVIVFAMPSEYELNGVKLYKFSGSFWPGYIGIMIAFIGNLLLSVRFFNKYDTADKTFLNVPILTISWSALIVTMIAGTVTMLIVDLPNWAGALICLLVLFVYAIAIIKASAAAEAVYDVEQDVKQKTLAIKTMAADAEALLGKCQNEEIKAACEKVYEALRYTDPMSNSALFSIENRISSKLNELSEAAKANDVNKAKAISTELQELISDRAAKCKALK